MTTLPPADASSSSSPSTGTMHNVQFWLDHPSMDDFTVSEFPEVQSAVQQDVEGCWQLLRQQARGANGQNSDDTDPLQEASGGRYEAEELLGVGSFGVVFRARDRQLSRDVALKILRPSIKLSPQARARFSLEGQMLARCGFEGVISIFEVGEFDEHPYIAMGLIDGPNLADYLAGRQSPLPAKISARFVQQIAESIHRAHQAKILHRDLKPSNVLLAGCNNPADAEFPFRPVVSDFGLAKNFLPLVDKPNSDRSLDRVIVGTVRYMSPEQASGRTSEICEASDAYALGVILFESLTGRCPFTGSNKLEILHAITHDPTPSARMLNKSVPRELDAIVLKCMAKDISERYQSAAALASDLECWLRGKPTRAKPAGRLKSSYLWARRNPALAIASGIIAIGLLVGGAIFSSLYRRANQNLALALEANHSMVRFAEETLLNVPDASQKKLELHLEALKFCEIYAEENRYDEPSLYELSVEHHYVGLAAISAEQFELAEFHLQKCIELVQRLSMRNPQNAAYHFDLFMNRHLLVVNFPSSTGLPIAELARENLYKAVALNPKNLDYQECLAQIHRTLGFRMIETDPEKGRALLDNAVWVSRNLAIANPDQPKFWKHAVGAATELAFVANNAGDPTEALRYTEQALEYYESYRDEHRATQLILLIATLQEKWRALEALDDPSAAKVMDACARVCLEVENTAVKYHYYRQVRIGLYVHAAEFSLQHSDLESSRMQLQQATEALEGYQPTLPVYQRELADLRAAMDRLTSTIHSYEP